MALTLVSAAACKNPREPELKPAPEALLLKPLDQFSIADMKKLRVLVETDYGNFVIAFYPEKAPTLVKNFIKLIQQGFYNGLYFHMVVPKYMVIAGDPKGDGSGGPGYWVRLEVNDLPHVRGAVGMSHPPFNPEQIGSQFYVMISDTNRQTNAYPVFGYVEKGMGVLDRIGDIPSAGITGKPPWKPAVRVNIQRMRLMVEESK